MMGGGGRGVSSSTRGRGTDQQATTALWGPLREIVSNRFGSVRVKVLSPLPLSKSQGLPTARSIARVRPRFGNGCAKLDKADESGRGLIYHIAALSGSDLMRQKISGVKMHQRMTALTLPMTLFYFLFFSLPRIKERGEGGDVFIGERAHNDAAFCFRGGWSSNWFSSYIAVCLV